MPTKLPKKEAIVRGPKVEVVDPTTQALTRTQTKIQQLTVQAGAVKITSNETYLEAGQYRQAIKGLLREIDDLMDPIVQAAHHAHKVAVQQKKSVSQPLLDADQGLMRMRLKWDAEQEQIRRKEEERLRLLEEEREREEIAARATALAEAGDAEAALELLDEPVEVQVKVESYVPRQEGMGKRTTWSAEVVDLMTLVKAVAKGEAPLEALEANLSFLNKQAQAFHGGLQIPGVRAVSKTSESVRGQ